MKVYEADDVKPIPLTLFAHQLRSGYNRRVEVDVIRPGGLPVLRHKPLRSGTRVRIVDHPVQVTLRAFTGVIVSPDEWDDHYVIRLDEPALYHHADGNNEELHEIVEHLDNLDILHSTA